MNLLRVIYFSQFNNLLPLLAANSSSDRCCVNALKTHWLQLMGFLICKFYLLNLLYRLLDRFRKYSCYISIQTQLVLEKTSIWWHDTCIQNFQEWFYLHNGKLGSSSLQHSNGLWWQQYGYHLLISYT